MEPVAFGKYLLVERLAQGGMAEVFRAVYQGAAGVEKTVAVKRILPALADVGAGDFVTMFIDEARIAASLTHVNVAQVFDFGEVAGSYYLAMELVEGVDLGRLAHAARREQRVLPRPHLAFLVGEAARGLAYAHDKRGPGGALLGIVHRDVSPQNVLVSYAGEVKIADFGIAKATGKLHKTESGAVMGKLRYMSPEQIAGEPLDGRSDVFSLGIILHELLTGRSLFDGDNPGRVAEQVKNVEIAPPSASAPDVAPELDRICLKALARARDARYERAADLARELSRFVGEKAPGLTREEVGALVAELVPQAECEGGAIDGSGPTVEQPTAPARGLARAEEPLRLELPAPGALIRSDPPVPPSRSGHPRATLWAAGGALVLIGALGVGARRWGESPAPVEPAPAAGHAQLGAGDAGTHAEISAPRRATPAERDRLLAELEALPQAEAAWRGVPSEDYLALLSAVDAALCTTPAGARELVVPADAAERLERRRLGAEARALGRYLFAVGELPPRVASSLTSFLQARPAYSPGGAGWTLAQLAVRNDPTQARLVSDLLLENGATRRWRDVPTGAPTDLCDRRGVVALYAMLLPGPRADALKRFLAATPPELPFDHDGLRYAIVGAARDEAAATVEITLRVTNPSAEARTPALDGLRLAGLEAAPTVEPATPRLPGGMVRDVRLRYAGVTDELAESVVLVVRPGGELQAYSEALR